MKEGGLYRLNAHNIGINIAPGPLYEGWGWGWGLYNTHNIGYTHSTN